MVNSTTDLYNSKVKDNFKAFMVNGAHFNGYYDIPTIPQVKHNINIVNLISYDLTKNHNYKTGDIVHFYIDDYKFDGLNGIWNNVKSNMNYKRGFNINRLVGCEAVIAPDFSIYLDMPRCMQIWNIYRSRAFGYYLTTLGFNVIPNVRWTDEESYKYSFDGVLPKSIVSVGTLGCSKTRRDKDLFNKGFIQMIKKINPSKVIIYGSISKELDYILKFYKISYIQFESKTSKYFRGINDGIQI